MAADGTLNRWDGTTSKSYNVGAVAGWEVDVFGKQTAAKRQAHADLKMNRAYAQAVQTTLVASVASTYYTLLMLDEQISIGEQTLQSWAETVSTLQALKCAGRANDVGILQAQVNKNTLEAALLSLQKSRSESENALCLLLAQTPHRISRGSLVQQCFPDSLSAGIPLSLLAHRPDVRQAEYALAKAFYATSAARAAFYPSLTLSGNMGWTNSGGGIVLNPGQWLLTAIGSLTQPLFNLGDNIAKLKVARAEQEIAALAFRQKLLEAGNEVNDALTAWQTARARVEINTRSIVALREAVCQTEWLMRYSSTDYLEVLTAQQSLLSARQALAQDKFDEIRGVICLFHALGGGGE